jgi:anti-anti-sigma factor
LETIDTGAGFRITPVTADGYVQWMVVGDLDTFRTVRLTEQIEAALARGADRHVIDLTGTTTMDAAGVCALIGLHKRCAGQGGMAVAATPGAQPWQMLTVTGAHRILRMRDTGQSAAQDVRARSPSGRGRPT